MVGSTGEPDQRTMAAWLAVNPLRVRRRDSAEDLDLRFDHAVCLRVCAADGSPATLDHRRFPDLFLPEADDLSQESIEIWIDRLYLGRVADELQRHLSALLRLSVNRRSPYFV